MRGKKSKSDMSSCFTAVGTSTPSSDPCKTKIEQKPSRRAAPNRPGNSGLDRGQKPATLTRRPSLPTLGSLAAQQTAWKKSSNVSLRSSYGAGSIGAATEKICRQLRAYRKGALLI
ncbi:hypothetical protein OPQ81_005374 [Rhizoctonia solani]|nr:hypothetical protein OPQ81_005374 [Rhizoctonia solani]